MDSSVKRTTMKSMKMRTNDYKNILTFYKIDLTGMTNKAMKEKAEHLLAVKLCRCIKNIAGPKPGADKKKEKRAISVCYNSVLKKKHLKIFNFNCKKTVRLIKKKGTRTVYVEKLK
jgi:hypothetical protein